MRLPDPANTLAAFNQVREKIVSDAQSTSEGRTNYITGSDSQEQAIIGACDEA